MSYPKPEIKAFKAGADFRLLQNTFVKLHATTPTTIIACGNDEIPHGILLNAPNTGEDAEVAIGGGAELKVTGSVSQNASLGSAAAGKGKAITTGAATAVAMEPGADGDIIPVLIDRHTGRAV